MHKDNLAKFDVDCLEIVSILLVLIEDSDGDF